MMSPTTAQYLCIARGHRLVAFTTRALGSILTFATQLAFFPRCSSWMHSTCRYVGEQIQKESVAIETAGITILRKVKPD